MSSTHCQVAQLFFRLTREDDIVYQNENVAGDPLPLQILLLLQQTIDQRLVPLGKEEPTVFVS